MIIRPKFVKGVLQDHFLFHQDVGDENAAGLFTYPESFYFLFRTDAHESHIYKAVNYFDNRIQKEGDTEFSLVSELRESNRKCGLVYYGL